MSASTSWQPSARELERRSLRSRAARRRQLISIGSTLAAVTVLAAVIGRSSGWPVVASTYFDVDYGRTVLPAVLEGLWLNIRLTLFGAPVVLVISLFLAVVRTSVAPALAPLRVLATVYVDVFRGVPLLLVIFLFGFGIPALGLTIPLPFLGVDNLLTQGVFLAFLAIVISYSAYVAEVIRSGILSVHPSQRAAARSLGLSQSATMRYVVLPQALRRVLPALLNDVVSFLKDTGLVSTLGVIDAIYAAQIETAKTYNYTPYVVAAVLFLLITVPLTRLVDTVLNRTMASQSAGGTA